ncbi:MAG: undecaprenyl/decaprenyl-phosphate alpha-N-acetylglucosaminyl 1-phosphate transferase [Planctomycetia bacterium]|nr:undecaprenyl/decaprenyl-phosphate alpha-N-acetylglucosaminyl 1-phosphate transferase [Planctomycetia bacterium]
MSWIVAAAIVPSLLVAWAMAHALRRLTPKWGLVDKPGVRKVHGRITPFGGGIAIWAAVVLPLAVGQAVLELWFQSYRHDPSNARLDLSIFGEWGTSLAEFIDPHLPGLAQQSTDLWFFLAGGTVLMLLGWADDARKLDWRFRLAVELLVAGAVVFGRGWKLTLFIDWPLLTGAISVLWIVALVNSFNMLDNMDGLAGGVAAIAATILAVVLLLTPDPASHQPQLFVAGFLFVLVGALVGFLFHNRPPARIFMGDAGSYFIGYCLAVMTILATFSRRGLPAHAILAPLCVLAVPLYDFVSVICIRLRARRSPFEGDTNHFSHRLVSLGLTKSQAVLTIYLTTAACGLGALVLHQVNVTGAVIIVLLIVCLLSVIAILETTARRNMRP